METSSGDSAINFEFAISAESKSEYHDKIVHEMQNLYITERETVFKTINVMVGQFFVCYTSMQ